MATDKKDKDATASGIQFEKPTHTGTTSQETEIVIEEDEPKKGPNKSKGPQKPKSQRILPAHLKSGRVEGDKRPHVALIGGSRRFGAYTRPVSINISEQLLPPITRRKIAIYEVLAFAKFDPLIKEGGAEIAPAPVILPGRYSINDPFEKDLANTVKVIQNVVGKERVDFQNPITGKMESQMVDNIQEIIMENGYLTVNMETEYHKYLFMELHPMNATCKWNRGGMAKVFRRSDFQYQTSISRQFELDLAMDAERLVKDMPKDEVINLAAAFEIPTMGRPIHELRYDLRVLARQDPKKLMFQRQDKFATVRINVTDAINWGLIEYVPEKLSYFFCADMNNAFHQVLVGQDPQESLAEFCLSEEGAEPYSEIENLLSFWK